MDTIPRPEELTFEALVLWSFLGFLAWFVIRYVLRGFYTVDQNERAVKTVLGRAEIGRASCRERV